MLLIDGSSLIEAASPAIARLALSPALTHCVLPMSPSLPRQADLTFEDAQKVLAGFNGLDMVPSLAPEQRVLIQRALQILAQNTDSCIFGVCADTLEQALNTLNQYATGLSYELPEGPDLRGNLNGNHGVYVKCNIQSGLFYASVYENKQRGVLLSYQSIEHPELVPLYGHLALDLFTYIEEIRNLGQDT